LRAANLIRLVAVCSSSPSSVACVMMHLVTLLVFVINKWFGLHHRAWSAVQLIVQFDPILLLRVPCCTWLTSDWSLRVWFLFFLCSLASNLRLFCAFLKPLLRLTCEYTLYQKKLGYSPEVGFVDALPVFGGCVARALGTCQVLVTLVLCSSRLIHQTLNRL
jgi:hypothetical protein